MSENLILVAQDEELGYTIHKVASAEKFDCPSESLTEVSHKALAIARRTAGTVGWDIIGDRPRIYRVVGMRGDQWFWELRRSFSDEDLIATGVAPTDNEAWSICQSMFGIYQLIYPETSPT